MGYVMQMSETVIKSNGADDYGKVVALGKDGKLDISVIPNSASAIQPRCRAYLTTAITNIPNAAWIPIPMQTVDYDTDNIHTAEHKEFKINTQGLYLIVHQNSITQGNMYAGIRKNGKDIISVGANGSCHSNASALVYLNAGEYIEPIIYQTTGALASSYIDPNYHPYLSIVKVSD